MPEALETTRAVELPPAWGRLDFLKITLHQPEDSVSSGMEGAGEWASSNIDRLGGWAGSVARWLAGRMLCNEPDYWGQWEDLGPRRGGVVHTWRPMDGLAVLCFERSWAQLEFTGRWWEHRGNEWAAALLAEVRATGWRWKGTRIDFAWDGFPASVREVEAALEEGRTRTRLKLGKPIVFSNEQGRTVYTGERSSAKVARWYDRRGPVRAEFEFKHDAAEALVAALAGIVPEEWPREAMAAFRGMLDFVSGESGRASRDALEPWWEEFVGDVEGRRLPKPPRDVRALTVIQRLDGHLERYHRILAAAIEAYGAEWLTDRIRWWVGRRLTGDDVAELAAELRKARGSKLGGAPEDDDAIPF